MRGTSLNKSPKQVISENIRLLLKLYKVSRKEVCHDLDISYTTFCDWVNGNTYPRIEKLETMGIYFRIETKDFFVEISQNAELLKRLQAYSDGPGVCRREEEAGSYTVEDYNETPENYPVELINGNFIVCESPNVRHQNIVQELSFEITRYIKSHQGKCRVFPGPFDVELPVRNPSVVIPDLTVLCDISKLSNKRCIGAPDWIIEVLSENSIRRDVRDKLNLYEEAGVREYWIVDQFKDRVHVYTLSDDGEHLYLPAEVYSFDQNIPVSIYEGYSIRMNDLDLL